MPSRIMVLAQLDAALETVRDKIPPRPNGGWIRAVRTALGMTAAQLAARMNASQRLVSDLERREFQDTVTLASLRRAAAALDCELHYLLVPREPLVESVLHRAKAKATERIAPVAHSMKLEAQGVSDSAMEFQVDELARELIERRPRDLWN